MGVGDGVIEAVATRLRQAYASGVPTHPVRDQLPPQDLDAAYAVQQTNTQYWVRAGRRLAGRKIWLTATSVQRQLCVDQSDFGVLFADMCVNDGEEIAKTMEVAQ